MRRHLPIFIHGHTHKRRDWLVSATLDVLLDILVEVLLRGTLVAIRIIVLFTLTLSRPAINALAGRTFLRECATFEPAARRRNGGGPLAMLKIVGCALSFRPRFTMEETDEPGEISGSDSSAQSSGYPQDVRRLFEIQERSVLSGSFGATLV